MRITRSGTSVRCRVVPNCHSERRVQHVDGPRSLDAEVEFVLIRMQEQSMGPLNEQPQLGLGVCRPHVDHDPATPMRARSRATG